MKLLRRALWIALYFNSAIFTTQEKLDKELIEKAQNQTTFLSTIKKLLEKKANSNAFDTQGKTAFSYLLSQKTVSPEKIKLFLEHKADCNQMSVVNGKYLNHCGDIKESPLGILSWRSYYVLRKPIILIRLFLEHKADPNMLNTRGKNLLHDSIQWLSDSDALKDKQGSKDLTSLIEAVLKYKGDINIQNNSGDTPFHALCQNDNQLLIECFLDVKGDPNIKNRDNVTPFAFFCMKSPTVDCIDEGVLKAFFERKVDVINLLEQSLEQYRLGYYEPTCYPQQKIFGFICFLLDKKTDLNGISHEYKKVFYRDNAFPSTVVKIFLDYNLDPTTTVESSKQYPYELSIKQDKRNMLAYAIPVYLKKKYRPGWEALLLCLSVKKKKCLGFNVPKYVKIMLCGDICRKINLIQEEIQTIEKKEIWSEEERISLNKSMRDLLSIEHCNTKKSN